jgi:hypothetical protein
MNTDIIEIRAAQKASPRRAAPSGMNLNHMILRVLSCSLFAAGISLCADDAKSSNPMAFLADIMIAYLDTNNDRAIDLGEFQAGCDHGFGEMDTDSDGFLSDKELGQLGAMLAESKEASGLVAAAAGVILASWIKTMDADHDGRVSREEFRKGGEDYATKLDVNKDHLISRDEILALPARILEK